MLDPLRLRQILQIQIQTAIAQFVVLPPRLVGPRTCFIDKKRMKPHFLRPWKSESAWCSAIVVVSLLLKNGLQKRIDHHTVQERLAFPRLGEQGVSSPTTCRTRRPSAARAALADLENVTQNGTSQHTVVIRVVFSIFGDRCCPICAFAADQLYR